MSLLIKKKKKKKTVTVCMGLFKKKITKQPQKVQGKWRAL